jgi:Asp/Glu/hydantoin racemase
MVRVGTRRLYEARSTPFYGAPIGILMIDSSEPFIPGDVGNASTFSFPVRFARVQGLTINRLLFESDDSAAELVIATAQELIDHGAQAIASNCGFMLRFQRQVADAVQVPVLLSGLVQIALVDRCIASGRRIGVLTSSRQALTDEAIALSGVPAERIVVKGLDACPAFRSAFLDEEGGLDVEIVRAEVVDAAKSLAATPGVAVIVMECAALPPYAAAIQAVTGLPVFDEVTLIESWYRAMFRPLYEGHY